MQWACHFLNVRRKALDPVVSGYQASGWTHFGALVKGITFWCAVFAGKSLLGLAENSSLQGVAEMAFNGAQVVQETWSDHC